MSGMGGLFASMAAGAAVGYGTNVVEQAKAKREAALRALELETQREYLTSERLADQQFRSGESALTRAQTDKLAQMEIDEDDRKDRLEQIRKGQEVSESMLDEDGVVHQRFGDGTWGTGKDKEGREIKIRTAPDKDSRPKTAIEVEKMAVDLTNDEIKAKAGPLGGATSQEDYDAALERNRTRLNELNDAGELSTSGAFTNEDLISEAREKVAQGADKREVIKRLAQRGIVVTEADL
jgi:hypothetical protein